MGLNFADQYSLLHFAVGVVLYFWNIPLSLAIILHTIFEIVENTKMGMKFINTYIDVMKIGFLFFAYALHCTSKTGQCSAYALHCTALGKPGA